jgi:hypothetical protein
MKTIIREAYARKLVESGKLIPRYVDFLQNDYWVKFKPIDLLGNNQMRNIMCRTTNPSYWTNNIPR